MPDAAGQEASLGNLPDIEAACLQAGKGKLPAEAELGLSIAHKRLDPRASIAILLLINAVAFAPRAVVWHWAMVGLCIAVSVWSGRGASALRWGIAYACVFAASWLFMLFPNSVAASFATMLVMVRSVFCIGMFASNMIATTRVGELACALQRAHVPRHAVIALCVALRFFPTMKGEFHAVVDALRVRGMALSVRTVLAHPVRVMENLLVPVMSRLSIVADELSNAAVVRGMDSDKPRTSFYDLRLHVADWAFLLAFLAVAGVLVLSRMGVLS